MIGARSIAVVYDASAVDDAAAFEAGSAEAAAVAAVGRVALDVVAAARSLGCEASVIALPSATEALFAAVAAIRADVVVNLVESYRGRAAHEAGIAWLFELAGLGYTGAPPGALALCLDKPKTRAVLAAAGVPVPRGCVIAKGDEREALAAMPMPCIVKPAAQDASHGIERASVCADVEAALARARVLIERGLGPALVEEYVEGRELNVSLLVRPESGRAAPLPIAEIDYSQFPAGAPKILTFAAKWDEESDEYKGSTSVRAELDEALAARVGAIAEQTFAALGLRDYGRVDLRVDARGPFVIDVNPNPDLSRGAGLDLAAQRAGIGYLGVIEGIVRSAHERRRRHP